LNAKKMTLTRQSAKETDRQTDRKADRMSDSQTDNQLDLYTRNANCSCHR